MGAVDVLVLALAAWRTTSLFVSERGPFDVFGRLRHLAGIRYGQAPPFEPYGTNWFAEGLACSWCASVWFGAAWALAYFVWRDVVWVALPLALSAGAILFGEVANG